MSSYQQYLAAVRAAGQQIDIMKANEQGNETYEAAAAEAARLMPAAEWDTLRALVQAGPLHDGGVPSKSGRDSLLSWGLASKAVVHGEQGFQCATYRGWDVWKAGLQARA